MKKVINLSLVLIGFLFCLCSCNKGKAGPVEYLSAIQKEEKLNKKVKIGSLLYTFCLITPEAVALQASINDEGAVNEMAYNKRLEELKGHLFINIRQEIEGSNKPVLKHNLREAAEYEQRVMYYEFYAKNDVKLLCNGKEYTPADYQYENHMGLSPHNTMVISFPKVGDASEWQIVFNDRAFNNLFTKVNFTQEDINQLPRLVLN